MSTEARRRKAFDAFEASWGIDVAEYVMEHLSPTAWPDVATRADMGALRSELRGEMAELRGEMAELRGELRGDMAKLRGEMGEFRGEVRAQYARTIRANIASMIGVAGLVFGAVRLG